MEGGPFTADQVEVPPEQGLRPRQECRPAWPWKQPAQGCQQERVAGLPSGLAASALKHAELMAEGKHLGAELGVGPVRTKARSTTKRTRW